jgi:hypothetical protein
MRAREGDHLRADLDQRRTSSPIWSSASGSPPMKAGRPWRCASPSACSSPRRARRRDCRRPGNRTDGGAPPTSGRGPLVAVCTGHAGPTAPSPRPKSTSCSGNEPRSTRWGGWPMARRLRAHHRAKAELEKCGGRMSIVPATRPAVHRPRPPAPADDLVERSSSRRPVDLAVAVHTSRPARHGRPTGWTAISG